MAIRNDDVWELLHVTNAMRDSFQGWLAIDQALGFHLAEGELTWLATRF